ncbi:MAG: GAF domain-containing protein [Candidatus Obscuribacterales bacterium]|nr:GAF domain-containing protein [Steroidobacteraceae bacterium]
MSTDPVHTQIHIESQLSAIATPEYARRDWAREQSADNRVAAINESADIRGLLNDAPISIHFVDANGLVLWANRTELDLLGYASTDYIGRPIAHFHADRTVIEDILNRLKCAETLQDYPARLLHKDGSIRHVLINSNVLWENGQFIHTRCFSQDVTERRHAEENIAASTRQKDALFQFAERLQQVSGLSEVYDAALHAIICALPCDRAAILLFDDADVMRFVASRDLSIAYRMAVEGHSPWSVSEKNPSPICVSDIQSSNLDEALKATIKAEGIQAAAFIPLVIDGKLIGKFMAYFNAPQELSEEMSAVSLTIARQLAFAIDRQRADDALRARELQLEEELIDTKLLQSLGAEVAHSADFNTLYEKFVDAAVMIMGSDFASMQMLYPERGDGGELLLLAFRGFDQDAAKFWEWVRADSQCSCGEALRTSKRVVIPDVSRCSFMMGTPDQKAYAEAGMQASQSTPLLSRSGEILGMISTHWRNPHQPSDRDLRLLDILARQAADLIERKQSEEALRTSDRRKDEFLATLAHELRNPLSPILNSVKLLNSTVATPRQKQYAIDVIDRQTKRMALLLDDLLDISRITRGQLNLRPTTVSLQSLIQGATETATPLFEEKQHNFAVTVQSDNVYLTVDPLRITQVLANLLTNAAKYSDPGAHITLTATSNEETIQIAIADTGIGLSKDKLDSVFAMFSQVDSSSERSQNGLGIGLALVKGIVELHGGSIKAHSDGLGCGSTFQLTLPRSA